MKFTESFSRQGIWWYPHSTKETFYGELKFSLSEGIKIELVDPDNKCEGLNGNILHGVTIQSGQEFTIILRENFSYPSGGSINTVFLSGIALFENGHYVNEDEICFDEMVVELGLVDQWYAEKNMTLICNDQFDVVLDFKQKKFNRFQIDQSIEMNIINHPYYKRYNKREYYLKEKILFSFKSGDKIKYSEWINYLRKTITLFTFFTNQPIYPISVSFSKFRTVEAPEKKKSVDYLYKFPDIEKLSDINYSDIGTIPYGILKDEFNVLCENWYSKFDKFEKVVSLYNIPIYTKNLNIETEFILYAQGLEAFHKIFIDSKKIDFKDRIFQLMHSYYGQLEEKEGIEKFLDKMHINRNYYTHWERRDQYLEGLDLYKLGKIAQRLLVLALLKELGLSEAKIDDVRKRIA